LPQISATDGQRASVISSRIEAASEEDILEVVLSSSAFSLMLKFVNYAVAAGYTRFSFQFVDASLLSLLLIGASFSLFHHRWRAAAKPLDNIVSCSQYIRK
jgi:hypothetical protein